MLIKDYLSLVYQNTELLDVNLLHIYKQADYKQILKRLYNQLKFFENLNIQKVKIADVGSGVGFHANYFALKGAEVTCYEPHTPCADACRDAFPSLSVKNSAFTFDKQYDIITLFGVVPFVSSQYIDNIFQHTKVMIIDTRTPYTNIFNCVFNFKYSDTISQTKRTFNVYIQ
jgi:2-polyprenyl-3-methyl-5-hydroxy-6-metoxy-1,4-benzoquinol methylase